MKNRKLLGALIVTLCSTAIMSSFVFSNKDSKNLFGIKAEEKTESITFSRATSIIHKNKFNTTFEETTSSGTKMYLSAGTGVDLTANFYVDYIAYMTSGHSLTITSDSLGNNFQEFQCLKSVTVELVYPNNRLFSIDVSTDGMSYKTYENIIFNNTNKKTTVVENGKIFNMHYYNEDGYNCMIKSITIEYTCSSEYIQDHLAEPTQADAPNKLYRIYGDTMSEAYGGAPNDSFTDNRITYVNRTLDPSNYACVYNSSGEVVRFLKKGLYYTSFDDVATYILAFKELPANYTVGRYANQGDAYEDHGEYSRMASGYYGLDYSGDAYDGKDTYPHHILPKSTDGNYFELDIGWRWADETRTRKYADSESYNRGPLKMVVFFKGVRAEGEDLNTSHYNDGNPVIFYSPDNFKTAYEYANYEYGWSTRHEVDQYTSYTPLVTK